MVVSHWKMQIPRFARDDSPNGCCQRKTTNGERLPSRTTNDRRPTTNDELLMTQIKFGTDGWRGDSRAAGQRLRAYARGFLQRQEAGRSGRCHGHFEPQSVELEWREVQSQVWRLGHAHDHEVHRRRTWRWRRPERPPARSFAQNANEWGTRDNRTSRSEARLRRSRFPVRGS